MRGAVALVLLAACGDDAPCWSHANGRLEVRVIIGAGQTRQIAIQ